MARTLADVKTYLGAAAASQWSDAELTSALTAEAGAQATRVQSGYLTGKPDVDEALMRRVARNLAMRKVPLGIATSEIEATRVTGSDPEIRRLEAPYRRLILG